MGLLGEFRDFAMRGNVVDMAVGVIIGAAFGKIVSTLVDKVMMPPLGLVLGGIDFADKKLVLQPGVAEAKDAAGAVIKATPEVAMFYGEFINVIINFTIVAFCLFMVIKAMNTAMNRMKREEAVAPAVPPPPTKDQVLLAEIRDILANRR
jgi:large conductance mechanosensitive channel